MASSKLAAVLICTTLSMLALGCRTAPAGATAPPEPALPAQAEKGMERATFAGGCFWCMERPFDAITGVISTTSGYTDGHQKNPSYKQVSAGGTGHTEALQVVFDPKIISYAQLVEVFWHNVDPTQANGQFCDQGSQYRSGIYWHDEAQKAAAEASLSALKASKLLKKPIVTELKAASRFYPAETYHQDFYTKNPTHYQRYRRGCGRDERLRQIWGAAATH